ncbi:MAG: hypothetical protein COB02_11410 [Candidatus Cloacimonadota bacterium]|nr:MAG: hypothetical protein COB02_11410 [Candidatus Cloacimonadota bacterium]
MNKKALALEKEPLLKKARWYNNKNRTYKACIIYHKVLPKLEGSSYVEGLEELAYLYFDRLDFDLAAICFNYLCELKPKVSQYVLKLSNCYFQLQNYYQSKSVLHRFDYWKEDEDEERLLALSQCELALDRKLKAIEVLQVLMKRYPNAIYYLLLSEIFENMDLHSLALEVCNRGLKRDPYFEDLLVLKARLLLEQDDFKKAKQVYFKMIKNQMFLGEAHFDLEMMIEKRGSLPELMEIFQYFDDIQFDDLLD